MCKMLMRRGDPLGYRNEFLIGRMPPRDENSEGYLTEPWRDSTSWVQGVDPAEFLISEHTLMTAGLLTDEELSEREARIYGEDPDDPEPEIQEEEEDYRSDGRPHRHTKKCRPGCAIVWEA